MDGPSRMSCVCVQIVRGIYTIDPCVRVGGRAGQRAQKCRLYERAVGPPKSRVGGPLKVVFA